QHGLRRFVAGTASHSDPLSPTIYHNYTQGGRRIKTAWQARPPAVLRKAPGWFASCRCEGSLPKREDVRGGVSLDVGQSPLSRCALLTSPDCEGGTPRGTERFGVQEPLDRCPCTC